MKVVKVGQAIGILDVPSLQRDFGIFVVNAFDTYEAGRLLRLPKLGLSALCEYYGLPHDECKEYHRLKKSYQMTDWRKRPLSPSMLRYGRFDVHYLIALRKLMIRDLTRGDLWDDSGAKRTKTIIKAEAVLVSKTLKALLQRSGKEYAEDSDDAKSMATSQGSTEDGYFTPEEDALDEKHVKKVEKEKSGDAIVKKLKMNANLMSVLSESQQRCLSFWKNKKEHVKLRHGLFYSGAYYDNSQSETKWSEHHSRLCEALVDWRQSIAKNEGTMPGLVFSTEFLMAVARKRPASHYDLRRLSYFLPELLQDEQSVYAKQLFELVQSLEFDRESCEPEELEAKYSQTTTANAEPEVTNVAMKSEEKFGSGEPINYHATTLADQTEGITRGHGKPTSDDHFGLLTYCITFVAFMAVGASVAVVVCRRYRR
jgi:ribonuclease D